MFNILDKLRSSTAPSVGVNSFVAPSFGLLNRLARLMWGGVWLFLFFPSPRPFHGWRAFLLRVFGAKLGRNCHIYPSVRIWAPWNLICGNNIGVSDRVILYNMDLISIGDYSVISQGAHLCGGSHDYNSRDFQLITKPIEVGSHVWVCADAFISPGVSIADGSVIAPRSVVSKNITTPWRVWAGAPVKDVSGRKKI